MEIKESVEILENGLASKIKDIKYFDEYGHNMYKLEIGNEWYHEDDLVTFKSHIHVVVEVTYDDGEYNHRFHDNLFASKSYYDCVKFIEDKIKNSLIKVWDEYESRDTELSNQYDESAEQHYWIQKF